MVDSSDVLCTALRLPSGLCILLTVAYTSLSVLFDVLLETMIEVLCYLQTCGQGMISIIMGYVNEDLLSKPGSKLVKLTAQCGN